MKTIAHRGASIDAPENTIKSILLADSMSADLIEIDVQLTKDLKVVLMHDKTVDRTTSLSGDTNSITLKELQSKGIPSLKDVLALNLKAGLIIEVKGEDPLIVKEIVSLVSLSSFKSDIIYKSFNRNLLKRFKELDPTKERVFVFLTSFWGLTIDTFLRFSSPEDLIDVEYYQTHYSLPNSQLINRLKSKGKKIILWGVNSKDQYTQSQEKSVYAIETDYPNLDFK